MKQQQKNGIVVDQQTAKENKTNKWNTIKCFCWHCLLTCALCIYIRSRTRPAGRNARARARVHSAGQRWVCAKRCAFTSPQQIYECDNILASLYKIFITVAVANVARSFSGSLKQQHSRSALMDKAPEPTERRYTTGQPFSAISVCVCLTVAIMRWCDDALMST